MLIITMLTRGTSVLEWILVCQMWVTAFPRGGVALSASYVLLCFQYVIFNELKSECPVKQRRSLCCTGGGCDPSDLLIPTQNPRRRSGRRQRSRPSSATFDVDEGVEPTASDSVVEIASPQTQRTARFAIVS